ncbi:hypothetical protein QTP70_029191, partial [Hemibagrus guttatus]
AGVTGVVHAEHRGLDSVCSPHRDERKRPEASALFDWKQAV